MLVDEDECWFSRFAQPDAQSWGEQPLHLVRREPQPGAREKALACFGAVRQDTARVYLYFSDGQPTSEQTWWFVIGILAIARQEGKRVVVMLCDNARWHTSARFRAWVRAYNRAAKAAGEPRLLVFRLPVKSPWLNPMEPRWVHARRAICEPDGDLSPNVLRRRLCAHFNTIPLLNSCKL